MPLYEYRCAACDHAFEQLVRNDAHPERCPKCAAPRPAKVFSTFAVGTSAGPASFGASPCGTCGDPRGPGACAFDN